MVNTLEIQQYHIWEKLIGKRTPLTIELEITARCNLNCRHCYINLAANDQEAQDRELSVKEILGIARQAVDMGAIWCLITGGEPLLRPDFGDIYMGLKRLGLLLSVFTNATLISNQLVELFKKYPPRDLEVTVYGATSKTFEQVTRRPGSFKHFMNGLNKLEANEIGVRLKSMALQSNFHEQQQMAAFCQGRTKDYYRFDPHLRLRFDGNSTRNKEILAERLTPEQVVALEQSDDKRMEVLVKHCNDLINEQFTQFEYDHLFSCGAGNSSFYVSYDGIFHLCPPLCAEVTTYDLRKGTLAEAWYDFVPQVLAMRSQRKSFLETCRKCPLVNLCLWCPAHAYLETGELDGSTPYFCEVAHRRAENIRPSGNKRD